MNKRLVLGILGGVVGLAVVVAIAASVVTSPTADESVGYGEVTMEGDVLPVFVDNTGQDPAAGLPGPEVSGADWDGNEVAIAADGRPKVVLFLAHWCPFCQEEVPRVMDWLEAGNQPEGVDFYAVNTLTDRVRANWPPQEWLEGESWAVPTLMDNEQNAVSVGYGMSGTPFWVVLDGDNQVLGRVSGAIGPDGMTSLFQSAAGAA